MTLPNQFQISFDAPSPSLHRLESACADPDFPSSRIAICIPHVGFKESEINPAFSLILYLTLVFTLVLESVLSPVSFQFLARESDLVCFLAIVSYLLQKFNVMSHDVYGDREAEGVEVFQSFEHLDAMRSWPIELADDSASRGQALNLRKTDEHFAKVTLVAIAKAPVE